MLYVNKQFSAEYRQCYYERTTFFLRIHASNVGKSTAPDNVPALHAAVEHISNHWKQTGNQLASAAAADASLESALPNFWDAPIGLLTSLRHCTIYIELGSCELSPQTLRNGDEDLSSLLGLVPAPGSTAATRLKLDVLRLVMLMAQLRTVRLVWETPKRKFKWAGTGDWRWELLGKSCAECLKGKKSLTGIEVKVGDSSSDCKWIGHHEDGTWLGGLQEWDVFQ